MHRAVDELGARQAPWLEGYRTRVLDGNHLSGSEHRLEPLRDTWAAALPGQALVVLDQERMLAEEVVLNEDGQVFVLEANANPDLSMDEDFAEAARAAGLEYPDLLERIMGLGIRYMPAWKEDTEE